MDGGKWEPGPSGTATMVTETQDSETTLDIQEPQDTELEDPLKTGPALGHCRHTRHQAKGHQAETLTFRCLCGQTIQNGSRGHLPPKRVAGWSKKCAVYPLHRVLSSFEHKELHPFSHMKENHGGAA